MSKFRTLIGFGLLLVLASLPTFAQTRLKKHSFNTNVAGQVLKLTLFPPGVFTYHSVIRATSPTEVIGDGTWETTTKVYRITEVDGTTDYFVSTLAEDRRLSSPNVVANTFVRWRSRTVSNLRLRGATRADRIVYEEWAFKAGGRDWVAAIARDDIISAGASDTNKCLVVFWLK